MGAGKHQEPPLTLSTTCSQCWGAPVQLFGQHPPGSDQLQGAVPLRLQVRDAARHHLLPSPAAPQRAWVPLGALAVAGAVLGAALLSLLRSDMVSVLGSYYYDDGCEPCGTDTFSREPFIVKFSSPTTREQSRCWGMPRPGTESPPCRAEPRAVLAKHRGLATLHQGPTHGCPGVLCPCPAWPAMPAVSHSVPSPINHLPSSVISHHVFSPVVHHLTSPDASHCVLHPIICYLPSCAISHRLLPLAGCHLPSSAIPHPFHLPSRPISHFVPLPTPCHHLHLPRTSSGHTHYPISFPKLYWLGNADGKRAASPKPCTKACSSPLEFPVWESRAPNPTHPFPSNAFPGQ